MNQDILDIHPLQFQLECNSKYGEYHKDGNVEYKEQYTVITWNKLTEEEYKEFNGKV